MGRKKDGGKRKRCRLWRFGSLFAAFIVLVSAFAVYFASQMEPVKKKYIYPYAYQELVALYADANGVPPSLVASVIRHESKFEAHVRSPRGAVGLMQLMPATAQWIAEELEDASFSPDKLSEPETNIRYGTWYLAELAREFDGNPVLVLAAYNAGRGTVHAWMEENGWPPEFADVSAIPYPETRLYVENVLKDQRQYEALYHSAQETR